jgi:tetratricopeptide (TPR) repeat protein
MRLEMRERFFGGGFVGTISDSEAQSALRSVFESTFNRASAHLTDIHGDLQSLGWNIDFLSTEVAGLRSELQTQTAYLATQLQTLASIDEALRTPAKTRAAERMNDAAGLLTNGRYELALKCAEEAIDGDPNHPGGFAAAGHALCGLGRFEEAIWKFQEADTASDPEGRRDGVYARMCARCLFVVDDVPAARVVLEQQLQRVADWPNRYGPERGITAYELAMACALLGDDTAANQHLDVAIHTEDRYARLAMVEPAFQSRRAVLRHAIDTAATLHAQHLEVARQRGLIAGPAQLLARLGRVVAHKQKHAFKDSELDRLCEDLRERKAAAKAFVNRNLDQDDLAEATAKVEAVEAKERYLVERKYQIGRERQALLDQEVARLTAVGWQVLGRVGEVAYLKKPGILRSKKQKLTINADRTIEYLDSSPG